MNSNPLPRGFSLIEALVALLVMGFGMLGVLGVQSALRQYADLSKQRSEAVRLAQEGIETWRAFTKLGADASTVDYTDIASVGPLAVTGPIAASTNTSYTLQHVVLPLTNSADLPQSGKWIQTTVRWNDRTGAEQRVDLHTHISGVLPELAGTLVVPPAGTSTSPARRPQGRHPAIPRDAVDDGTGKSNFAPPGMPSTVWTFDNASGVITRICNPVCTDSNFVGYLVSGFILFADPVKTIPPDAPPPGPRQPTGVDAESPGGSSAMFGPIGVSFDQTTPLTGTITCATATAPLYVAYYCAVPSSLLFTDRRWSGRSYITGPTFAADAADTSASNARACRYTPVDSHTVANVDHPLVYANALESLFNQNFLMIRAGDGLSPTATAFTCPDDGPATYSNTNTYNHQPSS